MICSIWLASARMVPRSAELRTTSSMSSPIKRGMSIGHFLDDRIQVHGARLENLHTAEGQKLPGESGGAIGGAVDLFHFARDVIRGRQNVQKQFGVALDDHE